MGYRVIEEHNTSAVPPVDIHRGRAGGVERALRGVWEGRAGRRYSALRWVLRPAAWVFWGITHLRSWAFRYKLLPSKQMQIPVISIGNLAMGGTGKTPIVRWMAEHIRQRTAQDGTGSHKPVAILTRGYGHRRLQLPHRVLEGEDAAQVGDEPALLKKWLPWSVIMVDASRARAARRIQHEAGAVLLDDGFQHQWICRDLEIVVVAPEKPPPLLPLGTSREPLESLKRAHILWVHGNARAHNAAQQERPWWSSAFKGPVIRSQYRVTGLTPLRQFLHDLPVGMNRASLEGVPLWLVAGLGRPSGFVELTSTLNLITAGVSLWPDHHFYTPAELNVLEITAQNAGARAILTTEKDAIRLKPWLPGLAMDWYVLAVEVEFLGGEDVLEQAISTLFLSQKSSNFAKSTV